MIVTVVLLILIQMKWIDNAMIIEKQKFREKVNKALFEIVKVSEEREALYQLTNSTVPFGKKDTALSLKDSKFLFEQNFIEDPEEVDTAQKSQSIYYLKGDSLYSIEAGSHDSLGNFVEFTQEDLKERIIGNISKKRIFIQEIINRMISGETDIQDRLNAVKIDGLIKGTFQKNGINYPYFYGVKDEENNFKITSKGFSLDYINQTYEIELFPNDILSSKYFLVVYFKSGNYFVLKNIPRETIISMIITVIIIITFALILFLILKQRKLSELKNDFINNMTHELKTPVSTISLASQMLSDSSIHIDKEKLLSVTKIIGDESKRLEFQIEKVLQISLFEKGNIHFNIQDVDIHVIIKLVVLNTDIKVKSKGGTITTNLKAKNHIVKGDKLHLTNIFFNLLDNAVKYSNPKVSPKIKINTITENENIRIEISDNGIGISKESQKKIFNKFYRVPTGNVHDVKGFGLGLSYVKRIMDEHQGHITTKSELGKGTSFILFLPVKTEENTIHQKNISHEQV
jgi:two-component system, OmpR family, phosphate regulon sensor histidine kinase PhoR